MITFMVPGLPVGKQRPRLTRRGKFTRVYTPEKTKEYERRVREAFLLRCIHTDLPLSGPLRLDVLAVFPRTKALLKQYKDGSYKHPTHRILHAVKPDHDNVRKCVSDGLDDYIEGGDSRIVGGATLKVYARIDESPATFICIRPVDDVVSLHAELFSMGQDFGTTL